MYVSAALMPSKATKKNDVRRIATYDIGHLASHTVKTLYLKKTCTRI